MSLNDLLAATDATTWASEFIRLHGRNGTGTIDDGDEDLMVTWFANAMESAKMNQTAYQAIEHAKSRAQFHRIIHDHESTGREGVRELAIAITKLEEAQMWFTRGLALIQGKFNPADLERNDG